MVAIATIHKAQPEKQPYFDQIAWLKITSPSHTSFSFF